MNTQAGLWINHYEAIVVVLREKNVVAVTHLSSHVGKDHCRADGSCPPPHCDPQDVASAQQFENRRLHQLNRFFDDVIDSVCRAQQLFVMGPGEAKGQFVKHLRKINAMKDRNIAVETRDKMTETQITDAVMEFFGLVGNLGR